jgi:hypothetical protein
MNTSPAITQAISEVPLPEPVGQVIYRTPDGIDFCVDAYTADQVMAVAQAAIAAYCRQEWQPIETAPRDTSIVWLADGRCPAGKTLGFYNMQADKWYAVILSRDLRT